MTTLNVRDLMTTNPDWVRPEDDLSLVYDLMTVGHFRHVPVLDEDQNVVGLVTHRDLLRGTLGQVGEMPVTTQRDFLQAQTVEQIMTRSPETIDADSSACEAGELMLQHKLGCLLVVEGGRLEGILTESDFVRHMVNS